ncbi:MAG: heavy metal-binding domain-containing protein [Candidatus Muiribacteriota bacterium]
MGLKFNCPVCNFDIVSQYLKAGDLCKCKNCGYQTNVPENAQETDENSNLFHKKENLEDIGNYNKIYVSTEDLERDYSILGVIFFNTANVGKLATEFEACYNRLSFEVNRIKEYNANSKKKNLNFQYEQVEFINDVDKASVIGLHELKKKAYIMEADAIIGIRQDFNFLPQRGMNYFSYHIYGTAVKLKDNKSD